MERSQILTHGGSNGVQAILVLSCPVGDGRSGGWKLLQGDLCKIKWLCSCAHQKGEQSIGIL